MGAMENAGEPCDYQIQIRNHVLYSANAYEKLYTHTRNSPSFSCTQFDCEKGISSSISRKADNYKYKCKHFVSLRSLRADSFLETLMAMRAAGFYISLLPRLCHGALHRQITSCGLLPLHRQTLQRVSMAEGKQSLRPKVVRASSSPGYESGSGGGRSIVDANMPLLRKRINKLKIQEEERKGDRPAPPEEELESEWMEWEKKLYPTYHFKVCEMIGLLHNYLIETRPSVALATLSLTVFVAAASVLVLLVTSVNSLHLSRLGA